MVAVVITLWFPRNYPYDVKLKVGMAVRYYYQAMQEGIQSAEGKCNLLNRLIPQSEWLNVWRAKVCVMTAEWIAIYGSNLREC